MKKQNESFDETTFSSAVDDSIILKNCMADSDIVVKERNFKEVKLLGCRSQRLVFEKCNFENLLINECEFERLEINNCSSDRYIDIQASKIIDSLVISGSKAKQSIDVGDTYSTIIVRSSDAPNVFIYGDKTGGIIKDLRLQGEFQDTTIVRVGRQNTSSEQEVSVFDALCCNLDRINLRVLNVEVKDVYLTGSVGENYGIEFESVLIKKMKIERLSTASSLVFNLVKFGMEGSELIIKFSNFGESRFNYCDFSKVHGFYLVSSILEDIKSVGTAWPTDVRSERSKGMNQSDENLGRSEVDRAAQRKMYFFRMRNIMASSGDRHQEATFRYLELDERLKENIKFFDKISLFCSKISSNHGENWFWTVLFMIGANFLLLWLLIASHSGLEYIIQDMSFRNFFSILNPIFKVEDLKFSGPCEPINEGGFYSLVYVCKVLNAYLYFQVVKSFRKYG